MKNSDKFKNNSTLFLQMYVGLGKLVAKKCAKFRGNMPLSDRDILKHSSTKPYEIQQANTEYFCIIFVKKLGIKLNLACQNKKHNEIKSCLTP